MEKDFVLAITTRPKRSVLLAQMRFTLAYIFRLYFQRDEKVKLADLLVGSAEGAEQMQMELEEQIELLTERLQQQKVPRIFKVSKIYPKNRKMNEQY